MRTAKDRHPYICLGNCKCAISGKTKPVILNHWIKFRSDLRCLFDTDRSKPTNNVPQKYVNIHISALLKANQTGNQRYFTTSKIVW